MGWLSALCSDLGFSLGNQEEPFPLDESLHNVNTSLYTRTTLNVCSQYKRLSGIAGYVYDFILDYDPMIVNEVMNSFHDVSDDKRRNDKYKSRSHDGLFIGMHVRGSSRVCL